MKRLLTGLLVAICLLWGKSVLAQADINMATQWYNRASYNPAFIARPDYLYIFSNVRHQWTGVEGAPSTLNVQVSEYINNLNSAFGISIIGDKIGATQAFNPLVTYAYRIGSDNDWSLSMGLSGGMFIRSINGSNFEADIDNDLSIQYNTQKTSEPDANAGLEFQNDRFIFGMASTHLFSVGKSDDLFLNTNQRYGYAIYKNNNLELFYYKVGLQVVNRYNLTYLEGNAFIRFKHATGLIKGPREIIDLGITLRSTRVMSVMLGLNIAPDIRVGYSYDHSFISGYTRNTTHEIMLEYRIFNKIASSRIRCGNEEFNYR